MSHTNAHRLPKSPRLRGFLFALFAVTAQIGHAAEEWKMGDDPAVFITASPHVQFSPDGAAAEIDGKNHGWHGVLFHTDPDKVKLGKGTVVLEFDLEVLEPFDRDAWLWATLEATSKATPDLPIGKFFDKRLDPDGANTFHLAQAGKQSHKIEISRSPDFALNSGGGFRAAFGLTKQGSFTTHGAGRMRISNVRLTSTPNGKPSVVLPAPKHLAPADNARLDPRALHFLWEDNPLAERFQIEIAGDSIAGGKSSHDVPSMGADASSFIIPEGLPVGDYRWRVRSVTADGTLGEWSQETAFSVHAPGNPVPPVLALSPDNPLFFFMAHDDRPLMKSFGDGSPEQEKWPVRRFLQYRKQWSVLPPEVKKHAAFEVIFNRAGRFREWAAEYDKLWRAAPDEYPNMVILARLFNDVWNLSYLTLPLSDFEWICRQDYPWFKGVSIVEQHIEWGGWSQEYFKRLLPIAAQYGQRVYWAEFGPQHVLNDRIGSDLIEVMRKHRDYLTIMHKCNSGIAPMLMMNQIFGQWFMGNAGTLGMSAEAWYWNSGYFSPEPLGGGPGSADRNQPGLYRQLYPAFPGTFWNIQLLLGAAQGAVVYRIEGGMEPEPPEEVYRGDFYDKDFEPTWNFSRNIIPLLEFLVRKKPIPTAREVIDEVKAVVIDSNTFPYDWNDAMGPLGPFFQVAPGFHYTYQMVPNSGRYYFIPAIFGNTVHRSRLMVAADKQLEIFTAADAKDPGQLRRRLDALYPKRSEGEACVLFAGESFYVFNSWENEDKPQSFSFAPPSAPGITAISGVAGPQSYLAGRASGGALHLQCANLRDRQSVLNIKARAEPALTVTPAEALVSRAWHNGHLVLTLKHDAGAVNLVVGGVNHDPQPPPVEAPVWPLSLRSFSAEAVGFTDDGLVIQFDYPGGESEAFQFRAGAADIHARIHPGGPDMAGAVPRGASVLVPSSLNHAECLEVIPGDASQALSLPLDGVPAFDKLAWITGDPVVSTNYGPVQAAASFVAGGDFNLLRLTADFTGNQPGDYACMSFPTPPVSFGPASKVGVWVKGDNSRNAFSLSFLDAKGEGFAYFLENGIDWNGWRFVTIPLVDHPKHPSRSSGHPGPDAGRIVWPLTTSHVELGYLKTQTSALEMIPELHYSQAADDSSHPVLVGRWQFTEGSGNTTVNSVNSVNAVLEGGASFGTLTDPFGGSNTVALGTGRYVDTMQGASDLLPTTGSYSISAWGYITNAASENWTLVGAADNVPPTQGNSVINGHASLNLARGEVWGPNASPYVPTPWQGGIANNAWNHFVLVNDSAAKTVKLYVNGTASLNSRYTGAPFTNPVGAWIFGGHQFFPGEIADVQFYRGTVTQRQITGIIMTGNAVTESNYNTWLDPDWHYSGWLAGYPSLTGANTNGAADPDGDGFANMEEYAFGGDPTAGTPALMAVRSNGTNVVFNWLERSYGVTYEVQRSGTLTNWTAAAGLSIYNSADQSGVPMAPTYLRKEFVTNPSGTDFFRIRATVTGP